MGLSFTEARDQVRRPGGMDAADATALLDLLMSGSLQPNQGADLLVALAERGETGAEVAAFVRGMLTRAAPLSLPWPVMDVCGTGGSGLTRFNVSTTVAFLLAAAGIPVAKHGNKGSARPNGSFDLLEALDIPYTHRPEALTRLQRECKLCFLFARSVHPAVAAVAPYRKAAGRRTIFNLAGPLANPVRPGVQVIGVINERVAHVLSEAVMLLGVKRACIVWGGPGIDEVSVTGPSRFLLVETGGVRAGRLPALHPQLEHEELPGGEASENATTFRALLAGEAAGPLRDMVTVNAGVAIDLWEGRMPTIDGPGRARAEAVLAEGDARALCDRYRALAQELRT